MNISVENAAEVLPVITSIIPIIIPIIISVVKIFSPTNKAIGIENYSSRAKARLKYSLGIIITFVIFTIGLGTYKDWMPAKIDSGKDNIAILGLIYLLIGIIFLIMCIVIFIIKYLRKEEKKLDKYQKNYRFENIRFGIYISVGVIMMGIAIIINNTMATILFSIFLLFLGVVMLLVFDYEIDRALLYYNNNGKKLYIYRTIDNDNILCGEEKNALSCKSYLIKNKDDVFKEELYIVDKKEIKKDNKKNISSDRFRGVIIKIINYNNDIVSILTCISAILVSIVLYIMGRTHITDVLIGLLIIGYSIIVELVVFYLCYNMLLIIKSQFLWVLKKIIENIKIEIAALYVIIFTLRICCWNKISIIEFTLHFIVLSIMCKLFIKAYCK